MGKAIWLCAALAVAIVATFISRCIYENDDDDDFHVFVPKSQWFGPGPEQQQQREDKSVRPFPISVSKEILQDLSNRLNNTRFFEPLEDAPNFHYGFNNDYLREVNKYWQNSYDWTRQENILNRFTHFKTQIEGIEVHFIGAKPPQNKYKKVLPLLMVHGWPGSVWEFHKIIPMLTDPESVLKGHGQKEIAFEVIAPSIPGYGWSSAPKKTGFSYIAAGRVFAKLMQRLKFDRYYCQGGDWGSMITSTMGVMYPDRILGIHLNMFFVGPLDHPMVFLKMLIGLVFPSLVVDPVDIPKMDFKKNFMTILRESGYFHLQATKPDTIGQALTDSPMGLAAYILEKFSGATQETFIELADGGLSSAFSLDDLLTNVMIYWVNGNIASSQRFYKEAFADPLYVMSNKAAVKVPVGLAAFPHDLVPPQPHSLVRHKYQNITRFTRMPRGGHFAALQEPKLLAVDVFDFVADL